MGKEKDSVERTLDTIRRKTRRQHTAEEKISIVLEGLCGEPTYGQACPCNPYSLCAMMLNTSAMACASSSYFFQPLAAWRHAKVTQQRKKEDFAVCMQELVKVHFPDAKKIRVVLDNLNTHSPAALYLAFPLAEARRILQKLEFHFTSKHGSWLNMIEIELSVLVNQCLKRRIPDMPTLQHEVTA